MPVIILVLALVVLLAATYLYERLCRRYVHVPEGVIKRYYAFERGFGTDYYREVFGETQARFLREEHQMITREEYEKACKLYPHLVDEMVC